jgi:3,4-dihydroxy 2-butanone 4-phosphate synthase/GTP cyclohydrolase II
MDDEDRENEGDIIMVAELVTPEAINFMATYGRGLICLTMTKERCEHLGLPPMVQAAVAKEAKAADLVQPGHIFPLTAQDSSWSYGSRVRLSKTGWFRTCWCYR